MMYEAHESQNRDRWTVVVRDLDDHARWNWYTSYDKALEAFVWELEHSAFKYLELFHEGCIALVYENNRLGVDLNAF